VTSLGDLLDRYLSARGLAFPADAASARKVAEQAIELVEECGRERPDPVKVAHELADVVLAAAVVARHHGLSLESAIEAKIALDTGRGRGTHRPAS
jgi:NTP pyrophosphatase (non-canonical NTP hydrolase)